MTGPGGGSIREFEQSFPSDLWVSYRLSNTKIHTTTGSYVTLLHNISHLLVSQYIYDYEVEIFLYALDQKLDSSITNSWTRPFVVNLQLPNLVFSRDITRYYH